MLWTVFMLFILAWMLGLIVQFGPGVIPLVIALSAILAFFQLIRRVGATRRLPARETHNFQ